MQTDIHNNTGTVHADRYTFLIILRSVLLRMRNVSDKESREHQNTHFVFNDGFFLENRAFCGIFGKILQNLAGRR